jgi:hypothetical protein
MPLLQILLALIVVGFLLWLVNRFIPMAGNIKSIFNGVVCYRRSVLARERIRNPSFSFANSRRVTDIQARCRK